MLEFLLLAGAGLAAGALNAVAGGGTFLTFPVLVWLGVPPISANATATLTALPGYLGSAWGYRHDLHAEGSLGLRAILLVAAFGAMAGALLLLVTPGDVFRGLVPWLLLAATALFAAGPRLLAALASRGVGQAGPGLSVLGILAVSVYGGYFNGGLGIMLLAMFGLLGHTDLHAMNGLKNVLSALLSLLSAATFVVAGLIAWQPALVLAIATAIGGWLGARSSRRIRRTDLLRLFVVAVGALMTVAFFLL